jgi:hypothetical protein
MVATGVQVVAGRRYDRTAFRVVAAIESGIGVGFTGGRMPLSTNGWTATGGGLKGGLQFEPMNGTHSKAERVKPGAESDYRRDGSWGPLWDSLGV